MKYCKYCGAEIADDAVVCVKCGRSVAEVGQNGQTIIVNNTPEQTKHNGFGIAGFVLSLVGVVFFWMAWITFVLLALGFIFSIVGICVGKQKGQKIGLAIAGLVLSLLDLVLAVIIIIVVGSLVASILSSAAALALL